MLLSSSLIKTWLTKGDEAFCIAFFESKLNEFLLINFLFSVTAFALFSFFSYFLDDILPYQWEAANYHVKFIIFSLFKPFLFFNSNLEIPHICFMLLCFGFKYLECLLASKVDGDEYSRNVVSTRRFFKMFVFHIILIGSSIYVCLKLYIYVSQKLYLYFMISFIMDSAYSYMLNLINYIMLFLGIENIGNNNYIKIKFYSTIVIEVMNALTSILYIYILEPIIFLMFLSKIPIIACNLFKAYNNFRKWKNLFTVLNNNLEDAKAEDLLNENSCIICRSSMHVGNAKKLPCSHCYHLSCLQQWIIEHSKCPLCQYDISQLMKNEEQEPNLLQKYINNFVDMFNIQEEEFEQQQQNQIPDNIPNIEVNGDKVIYRFKRGILISPKFDDDIKEMKVVSISTMGQRVMPIVGAFYDSNDQNRKVIIGQKLLNFKFNKEMNITFFALLIDNIVEIECNIIHRNIGINLQNLSTDELIEKIQELQENILLLRNRFKEIIDN